MTQEEEQFYRNMFDMFGSKGWKQLVEQLQEQVDGYNISGIQNEQHLFMVKGEINILNQLINLQATAEATYESAKEDEGYAADEDF